MIRKILILFSVITLSLHAQEKLSLSESINLALKNNPNIKISKAEAAKAEVSINEISSMFYPKIGFNASYTRLSDVPDFQISVPIFPAPITVQETILNSFNLKLGFTQPLFTGFKLTSMKSAAELKAESATFTQNAENNKIVFQVVEVYHTIVKAETALKLIQKYIEALQNHLKDTKSFLDNGLVTHNDYLKIELELSRLKLKKIDAENKIILAKNRLKILTGLPTEMKIHLENNNTQNLENITFELNELIQHALGERFELKSVTKAEFAAGEMINANKSEYYPSVYLFGNLHYSNPNQRYMPVENKFNESWDAGVSLQWELWNWGGSSSRVNKASLDKEIVAHNKKLLGEVIKNEVMSAYLTYKSTGQMVKVNEEALVSAKENYRLMSARYKNQLVTGSELIDAEAMLLDAEINLNNAKHDLIIDAARVKQAAGYQLY